MCGIAGIIAPAERLSHGAVEKMVSRQRHRGPDDYGIETIAAGAGVCMLGSCRLAIIDLSPAGHMPMADHETGNWLVYNGEIYNFRDLRQELENSGERFYSGTDTEVILKAYRHWGSDCVQRFRGMFAFALWDHARQELFLVRDRLGKKPLYYYQNAATGIFLFASEVRALLASGLVERHLNPSALGAFLFNGFVVSPQTMIKDLRSLLPGYCMRVGCQGNIITMRRYWSLPTEDKIAPPNPQWQEEIRAELAQAVKLRLVSDVPLGAFLSGGLDSSAIVALMAQSAGEVRTFSITFDESAYDESPFSRWVAHRFGTVHSEIRLDKESFQSQWQDALLAMDQPTFDGINTYCVARAAKESGLTVALSGLGADELFGGYPFFRSIPWLFRMGLVTNALPQVLRRLIKDWLSRRPLR